MSEVLDMYQKKFGTKEKKQFAPQQMNPTTQENLAINELVKMKRVAPATAESLKIPALSKIIEKRELADGGTSPNLGDTIFAVADPLKEANAAYAELVKLKDSDLIDSAGFVAKKKEISSLLKRQQKKIPEDVKFKVRITSHKTLPVKPKF